MLISAKRNWNLFRVLLFISKKCVCITSSKDLPEYCMSKSAGEALTSITSSLVFIYIWVFSSCVHLDNYEQSSIEAIFPGSFTSFSFSCPASSLNNKGMICNYALLEIWVLYSYLPWKIIVSTTFWSTATISS